MYRTHVDGVRAKIFPMSIVPSGENLNRGRTKKRKTKKSGKCERKKKGNERSPNVKKKIYSMMCPEGLKEIR
jgi:hypothetical protein